MLLAAGSVGCGRVSGVTLTGVGPVVRTEYTRLSRHAEKVAVHRRLILQREQAWGCLLRPCPPTCQGVPSRSWLSSLSWEEELLGLPGYLLAGLSFPFLHVHNMLNEGSK